jgi:hypothetical protein
MIVLLFVAFTTGRAPDGALEFFATAAGMNVLVGEQARFLIRLITDV